MSKKRGRIIVSCKTCNKQFSIVYSRFVAGRGKFCSKKCYAKDLRTRKEFLLNHLGNYAKKDAWTNEMKKKSSRGHKKNSTRYWLGKKREIWWREKINKRIRSKEVREKNRKSHLGRKLSKKTIRKCLRRRKMSGLEKKVDKVIKKYNLPYKFVGNGKFFIERKNPDFININGEKKAIEVYWKRHKDYFRGGCDKWKEERRKIFEKYGWELIFIEGTGLNEKILLNYLKGGG